MENLKKDLQEISSLIEQKHNEYQELVEKKASKDEVTEVVNRIKGYEDKLIEIQKAITEQGEMLAKRGMNGEVTEKSIAEQLSEKKEAIERVAKSGGNFSMTLKSTITSANIVNNNLLGYRVEGIGRLPYRRQFLKPLFAQAPVPEGNGNVVIYTDETNANRAGAPITEAGLYPATTSIDWQVNNLKVEKIGDSIKVPKENLTDFAWLEAEIRNLLVTSVDKVIDEQILTGNGTSPNLVGIDASATTFAAGAYATSIPQASLYDLISVSASLINEAGEGMYSANIALVNPSDYTKLLSTKDANGDYVIPPFATENGRVIKGVRVVESTLVPANSMYVFDSTMATVYNREGMTIELANQNVDDFDKDLVTLKAYFRLAFLIRSVHAGAFLKVPDIAAAITAINQP